MKELTEILKALYDAHLEFVVITHHCVVCQRICLSPLMRGQSRKE